MFWIVFQNNDVGEKAWQLDDERNEYYYNRFMKEEPELNLRNDRVVQELLDVLKFWLDLGVDGFYLDSVSRLFDGEDPDARWLEENFAFVYRVRKMLDDYSKKEGRSHPRYAVSCSIPSSQLKYSIEWLQAVDGWSGRG